MRKSLIVFLFLSYGIGFSQVTGVVFDNDGNPLPGASVVIEGTITGTSTNFDGEFQLDLNTGDVLLFSFIGFESQRITYEGAALRVVLQQGLSLDEVLVTGNRNKPRTEIDSAVPIDNIQATELIQVGEASIERALTFIIPSFNAQDQAISDATAGFAPADIRGLGPSRTLVLINGKRVNQQAQAYLNRTPGKGEVGVNLKAIPIAAIERIEVLRDGASSQYGSDAMAGVINFILKEDTAFSVINTGTGITSEGDGFQFNIDYNTTFSIGNGGRLNLTLGYIDQERTNRAGAPGTSAFDINTARPNEIAFAKEDPTLGMIVGRPDLKQHNILVNFTHPLSKNANFYTIQSFSKRWNRSFAYYRFPGWRRDVADAGFLTENPDDFRGYHPTFEGDIQDHFNVFGFNFELGKEGLLDLSVTHGANSIDYAVDRSVNRDYLAKNGWSPTRFHPGGYALRNIIYNADYTKTFDEMISFSTGVEFKNEQFEAFKGDPFSRYGGGSDSFAGISEAQEGSWERSNFGIYAGVDMDFTEKFLVAVALRYEDFTDVGDNFSWKIASRLKLSSSAALRASFSTGFRAPSLHQQKLSNTQYIVVVGSAEPLLQGTIQNGSAQARALGIQNLFPETSQNISAGLTFGNATRFSGSIDFYSIRVNDRVFLLLKFRENLDQRLRQISLSLE
jgi:iron complex outermembrane receptor protein